MKYYNYIRLINQNSEQKKYYLFCTFFSFTELMIPSSLLTREQNSIDEPVTKPVEVLDIPYVRIIINHDRDSFLTLRDSSV